MSEPMCPICGGATASLWPATVSSVEYFSGTTHRYAIASGHASRLEVRRCTTCGHGHSVIDGSADIEGWYRTAPRDDVYLAEEIGRRHTVRTLLRRLGSVRATGTLIDIGASAGFLVDEAKKLGWSATGLEIADWALLEAKNMGITGMQKGGIGDLQSMSGNSVDALTAIDVIEHVPNPKTFLLAAVRALKPGGAIVLVTPRFDSVLARVFGKHWYAVMPAHLHYFTGRSLTSLLQECGFTSVSVRSHVRHFGIGYLFSRLGFTHVLAWISHHVIPVQLFDTLEVMAVKVTD